MIVWLIIIVAIIFLVGPHVIFCALSHPIKSIMYVLADAVDYVVHKKKRLVKTGYIVGFIGLFGRGKTLSAVHHVCSIYRAKDGLHVYCPRRKKWVTQKIHIVSNVHLHVPYEKLDSLKQVVMSTDTVRDEDDANDTLTVTLVLIDEAGSELNSREFRDNIDPLLLNSILTCRHWNISIYYTA